MNLPNLTIDKQIFLENRPVYFYVNENCYLEPNDITIENFCFKAKTFTPTTMVIPVGNRKILTGDDYIFLNPNRVQKFYSPGLTEILDHKFCETIYTPSVHLVADDVWSFTVNGEAIISVFKKFYEQYVSITGVPNSVGEVEFHLDVNANYRVNLQRQPIQKRKIFFSNTLTPGEISQALFYCSEVNIKKPDLENLFLQSRKIQAIFNSENLNNVIIGSMAELLNGIECCVNDVDFMFTNKPSMVHAAETLKEYDFNQAYIDDKLIRLDNNKIKIDLTYDNYNLMSTPFNIKESNGFRFFDIQGLMWLCLLNNYESNYNNNRYPRNDKALYEISKHAFQFKQPCNSKLVSFWQHDYDKTQTLLTILNAMKNMKQDFSDVKVNDPFRVNVFCDEKNYAYSIINLGDENSCRVITPFQHKSVFWISTSQKIADVLIENKKEFSIMKIDNIDAPGVLFATDREVTNEYFRKELKI